MSCARVALVFAALAIAVDCQNAPFHVIREWKYVNFTWRGEDAYQNAMAKGLYVPENNIIAGLKYYDDAYYLTLPRMKSGVPATLAKIPAGFNTYTSPSLQPFPSWEMNLEGDCNALQNVQNIEIDSKGMMWVIDGGRTNTLGQPEVKCAPKLIIYDIRGNRETTAHTFSEEVASKSGSFLYDLVVDQSDGGYAYITDNSGKDPGIIVFSLRLNRSWKLRHSRTMRADPTATTFKVGETTINSPINVAAIALGPQVHDRRDQHSSASDVREVYYCPLSSLHLYSINTTVLKSEEMANNGDYQGEINNVGMKASQTASMIMDNKGVLYYGLLGDNSVARWDSHVSFTSGQRVITRDAKYIQWTSAFAFDGTGNLTVVTNRLQKFIHSTLDLGEENFRLLSGYVGGKSYVEGDGFGYQTDQPAINRHWEPSPSPEPYPNQPHHQESTSEGKVNRSSYQPQNQPPQQRSTASERIAAALSLVLPAVLGLALV